MAFRVLPRALWPTRVWRLAEALPLGVRDPGFEVLLQRIDASPLHRGNAVTVFFDGPPAFASMCDAIMAVGPEHVTLSSDAGEPLFPNTVECIRLMRGYMRAFGLTEEEMHLVSEVNPAKVLGLGAGS